MEINYMNNNFYNKIIYNKIFILASIVLKIQY